MKTSTTGNRQLANCGKMFWYTHLYILLWCVNLHLYQTCVILCVSTTAECRRNGRVLWWICPYPYEQVDPGCSITVQCLSSYDMSVFSIKKMMINCGIASSFLQGSLQSISVYLPLYESCTFVKYSLSYFYISKSVCPPVKWTAVSIAACFSARSLNLLRDFLCVDERKFDIYCYIDRSSDIHTNGLKNNP